jgi:hypothetical protein
MVKYPKEFQFICEDEISYFLSGAEVKTTNLTLRAPSGMSQNAPLLSQDIMVAIKMSVDGMRPQEKAESQQSITDDKVSEIKAKDILALIYSSKVIDMIKFRDLFIRLLLEKNICLLDGQVPITRAHFEFISYKEFNRLVGEYISNFLIP